MAVERSWLLPGLDVVPSEGDRRWISHLAGHLPFLADLIPADLFIFCPRPEGTLVAVGEAKPTVRESFYRRSIQGNTLPVEARAIYQALASGEITEGPAGKVVNGQPMHQAAYPMRRGKQVCGVVVVERNLHEELQHTEQKRALYRTAVSRVVTTLIDKSRTLDFPLPPVAAGDATLILGVGDVIRHTSFQAGVLARRLGLSDSLDGLTWEQTFPAQGEYRQVETNGLYEDFELVSRREAFAIRFLRLEPADDQVSAIVLVRDITALREKDRELAIKETIIREVHHRVKNNLQTIAGLLRLQMRRSSLPEVKEILKDSIERISSIALVHEYLAQDDVGAVDLKDLCYNLLSAAMQGMASPETSLSARIAAPKERVTLPSAQATSVALVVNELLQNTCKHAFKGRERGAVDVVLQPHELELRITVKDDGIGLPEGFDVETRGHLGWQIVRTLVQDDLCGQLEVESTSAGTSVSVRLPNQFQT